MTQELKSTISNLWQISRTALATSDSTRWDRMNYVKKELVARYPNLIKHYSPKQLWFAINDSVTIF